ncbi:replicative helicase loader/inhibitor [Parageobacillus thermoglucosidasius]|uniref:replicative helicase loader/inhibitor n=1 Tax=Parageobacillus thermoglucosidasius TaxID=1426 RepID=UPI000E129F15|nr:replicative helicase loader/inhibitor [Parageobacillus thermoglucosidasius]REK58995.1 MAG: hypothetical protein C6P36_02860 [Geobacillus sp.]MED4904097.1 replicative helicase loader/inhibitor [Parageobacillus thermoglucosidasius]MED4915647.1 replicative helicase loader/inhibitor [Parageobacillus thermoglucosidasius]MED4945088.1 replicative helicase loader/inhibitor [Parageobacillus thermoglucosidasius]MED4983715.1 replicative helicase loader/inhibitor [Parageobacillus thermoglucosidasius]
MNRQEALDILWRIAAAYTQFDLQGEIGKKRVEVWTECLEKMPYDRVLQNVNKHISESKFPPTIAEISAYDPPKNEFLTQYDEWLQQGRERIEHERNR